MEDILRPDNNKTQRQIKKNLKLYSNYLKKNDSRIGSGLKEYFSPFFFHDGTIDCIKINKRACGITMDINCPNYVDKITGSYINVDFTVEFFNVQKFEIINFLNRDKYPFNFQDNTNGLTFYCCEICTLVDDISEANKLFKRCEYHPEYGTPEYDYDDECFQSIIIHTCGDDDLAIKIVFESVYVYPKEPLAFYLLKSSREIVAPGMEDFSV